jgi:signal transduction histidine kinase/ActR/RegA family two-component response regulator
VGLFEDAVDIRSELDGRGSRPRDHEREATAFALLVRSIAEDPRNALHKVAELAVQLCDAGTAGVSVMDGDLLRREAVAGACASMRGTAVPRADSPCGVCVERNEAQLMRQPERRFPGAGAELPFVETLLVPFHEDRSAVGTVWAASHEPDRKFDAGDERTLLVLSQFASAAWQLWQAQEVSRASREAAVRERELLVERELLARRDADRQRDNLYSSLAQAPTPMVVLRGPRYVIELANPSVCEAWRRSHDEIIGQPLFEALPELHGQCFRKLLDGVLQTGQPYVGKEVLAQVRQSSGQLEDVYFNFVYTPLRNVEGDVQSILVMAVDVSDEVMAREQTERLRAEAVAATRSKDEFLAMLGHELRNPLSPILTAVQLMRMRGKEGPELEIIQRQLGHLVRLVDDLLDISRITRGNVELRKEPLELASVVLRGLEMASPLLEQRRQEVDVQVPSEGLWVEGDAGRLAQVVSNLLTNAAKYSDPGTKIFLRAERDGELVRLRVRDQGIGIPPELLGRIFDTFVQQPQSLDRSNGGLGLGLAIVRSLVTLHGGTVEACSGGLGQGSEFIIELPFASDAAGLDLRRAAPARASQASRGLKRILVVDDNEDAAESLAQVLGQLGYDVQVAYDGPAALQVAQTFKPNVCLLDIGLPVMDGYELARRLREFKQLPEDLRIVAVTGYGRDADRRRSQEAGFNDHLVKPVSVDTLTNAVRAASN